ncbi:LssY C-terminal domain-containing protein [Rothia sp. AR01]|uniref:LssY C-terminal domain-containing protein n=1 Tax=Rothia santali TaxID=2949643 RepID=A0A9X2HAK0_9MICC|nr:LssY C-terminal domain-containing protein [Rothia santali]MCP3425781.1 LssY C-terminal domain-containing protein [Rothia santali]
MQDDPDYPVYRGDLESSGTRPVLRAHAPRRLLSGFMDKFYFFFAGLASVWLAVVALLEAVTHSWWSALLILVFWGLLAYLTLPRLHRILTAIYVPDYFIGRTQTSDGLLGDPINLALRGESGDVHTAMRRAGWTRAEEVTLASSWRIVDSTLRRASYPEAPVSPLLLFGRKQDFAYQQEVGGNPGKRHHVRFWKTPEGWVLPGGIAVDWVAAGTYDRSVGVSLFTLQVTHKIDADTDRERDYIVETVTHRNPEATVRMIEDFSTGYHSRNGGGDSIRTDGDLPILGLDDVVETRQEVPDHHPSSRYSHHRHPAELIEKAPLNLWVAGALVSFVALLQMGRTLYRIFEPGYAQRIAEEGADTAGTPGLTAEVVGYSLGILTAILVILALFQVYLAVNAVRGRQRARKAVLALLCLTFVANAVSVLTGTVDSSVVYAVYVLMGSQVAAMLAFTSDSAVNYTVATTRARRTRRRERRLERRGRRGTPAVAEPETADREVPAERP